MATLTTKLTLQSTNTLSDATNVTTTDTLTVTNPTELSRKSIATGSAQALIDSNSAYSYAYIKVISGANATDFLQVKLAGDALLKLRVGEFTWLPLYNAIAITAESYGGACVVEYGYWSIA
jgi:hypothetical protein